jgi:hypothetical protein
MEINENQNGVKMIKDSDEKIEEFAYNLTTERLKELVKTMSEVLSIVNIEQLKDLKEINWKKSHIFFCSRKRPYFCSPIFETREYD